MPNDTFTLGLFDNTALPSWPCPTSSTAADLYDEDEEADAFHGCGMVCLKTRETCHSGQDCLT